MGPSQKTPTMKYLENHVFLLLKKPFIYLYIDYDFLVMQISYHRHMYDNIFWCVIMQIYKILSLVRNLHKQSSTIISKYSGTPTMMITVFMAFISLTCNLY